MRRCIRGDGTSAPAAATAAVAAAATAAVAATAAAAATTAVLAIGNVRTGLECDRRWDFVGRSTAQFGITQSATYVFRIGRTTRLGQDIKWI